MTDKLKGWIIPVLLSALLTGGAMHFTGAQRVDAELQARPTRAETRTMIERESPYVADRNVLIGLPSEIRDLTVAIGALQAEFSELRGEIRASRRPPGGTP